MPNPSSRWDKVPVFGIFHRAPGDTPEPGTVTFTLANRMTRVDGRVIYPAGARELVTIGDTTEQDSTIRSQVRAAWRAADQTAAGAGFDGVAWDTWWDDVVVPAAIFTWFPALDDPDMVQDPDNVVMVEENLDSASGKKYAIRPLLAHRELPIPGINLGTVEVPPGAPTAPAPVYAKGIAGGVASLDDAGKVPLEQLPEDIGGGLDEAALATYLETGQYATTTDVTSATSGLVPSTRTVAGKPLSGNVSLVKGDVGLANVDNTSDAAKPLSTAATAALAAKADLVGGVIPTAQLPPLAVNETFTAASQAAMLALTAQRGDMAIRTDSGRTYVLATDSPSTLADWKEVQAAGQVTSVAGKTGVISLAKADVGLGSVDNTADTAKPVSTAQQTALNLKRDKATRGIFPVRYVSGAWEYTTEAAATAAGMGPNDVAYFIGNPGGTPASWMRDYDLWTQG